MTATRLGSFIQQNIGPILSEWELFAKTRIPAAATMSVPELRDHAEEMLRAIADDIGRQQTEAQRDSKSRGLADATDAHLTAASAHGAIRHLSGFDLIQVVSEFRALRAAVLRLWGIEAGAWSQDDVEDLTRFSESIDQALAESVASYSAKIDESRDTFLAVLGHDLRGPLASLSNCVQLQSGAGQSPDTRDRVFHIATRSIASMEEMITDLLEYTRTRLGRGMEVSPQPGNLGTLCGEILEEARAAHPGMRLEYAGGGDLVAVFDHARIRQVLINLLNNAVQHGDASSTIVLAVGQEDDKVRLVVRNHGIPVPAEALQVIFNPLVQVAKSKSEPHERPSTSLGLGLFIAREIVLAHGGTIEVSSSVEAGTEFTVRLPKKINPDRKSND
jgi:signal transduction histidine kinase